MSFASIGHKAPPLAVSEWVQGDGGSFSDFTGRVVLVEVFQVNCPGCFLYALPQAVEFYHRYAKNGLVILGLATAFEDFELNALANLKLLSQAGQVVGETLRLLTEQELLVNGCLNYSIPFPLGMDELQPCLLPTGEDEIIQYIDARVPQFAVQPIAYQNRMREQVRTYLDSLEFRAKTFEQFNLQGTPTHILVDKHGLLRRCAFGYDPELETVIQQLLVE